MTPDKQRKLRNKKGSAGMVRLAREAMRTRFEALLADSEQGPAYLRAAGEEALEEIAAVERRLSAYRDDSDLFAINARAATEPVRVDARTLAFLQEALRLSEATDGAFDLTVGPLLDLWSQSQGSGTIPSEEEIAAALPRIGPQNLRLDDTTMTVRFALPGMRLDPGAIGKGYALERALELLRENGVRHALVHGGTSSVCALGTPDDADEGWPVAVQNPRRPDHHLAVVVLRDNCLSVSAVHGKSFHAQGRIFGHVLNPRTGWPVEKNVLAAVVAPSATETDALSTALLVLGEAGLPLLAVRFPEAGFLLATEDANTNTLHITTVGNRWRGVTRP